MKRHQVLQTLVLVCTSLIVIGCSTTLRSGPAPDWIDGRTAAYPPKHFLTGVGQSNSRESAEQQAYAAIAKVFQVKVMVRDRDRESYVTRESGKKRVSEHTINLDRQVQVSTEKVLKDVRIEQTWQDQKTGSHYALAVMNLDVVGAGLRTLIAELDAGIERHVQEARNTSRSNQSLQRVKHLRAAINDLGVRKTHVADLRIILPGRTSLDAPYNIPRLRSELSTLLAEHLVIAVEVTGDEAELVRRAVVEGLVREGLPVTADRLDLSKPASRLRGEGGTDTAPNLVVRGNADFWPAMIPDPTFTYVRWCTDFVVVEMDTRRVIGALSHSGKEGHLTFEEAKRRALNFMQPILTTALAKTIAAYIYDERDETDTDKPAATCLDRKVPKGQFNAPVLKPLSF